MIALLTSDEHSSLFAPEVIDENLTATLQESLMDAVGEGIGHESEPISDGSE
jgi:hypothetical protein